MAPKLNLMLPGSTGQITCSLPMQSKLLSTSSARASASPSQRSKAQPSATAAGAASAKTGGTGSRVTQDSAEPRFRKGRRISGQDGEQLKIREEEQIQETELAVKIAQKRMGTGLKGFEWEQMR